MGIACHLGLVCPVLQGARKHHSERAVSCFILSDKMLFLVNSPTPNHVINPRSPLEIQHFVDLANPLMTC
ncbi:hypothetical protein BN1012_Phect2673 [Candidatus Phaeomarinobacter ectocarpi]|uniref:Uncharacterized protein n=1 Tax=Candidatus Phaeomarinibacter ectocarpi TaxID=1458461 RepID=X5MP42_9HYPH|nr:hypothetical protein BN1012_Phect2673 [Candidatus Phaeomarinobacter ectocarpi]